MLVNKYSTLCVSILQKYDCVYKNYAFIVYVIELL